MSTVRRSSPRFTSTVPLSVGLSRLPRSPRSASITDRKPAGYRSSMSSPVKVRSSIEGHSPVRPMRPPNRASPRPMVAFTSSNRTLDPVKVTRPLMASMACGSHMCRSRPPAIVALPLSWGFSIVPVKSAITSARPAPRMSLRNAWRMPRFASPSARRPSTPCMTSTLPLTASCVSTPLSLSRPTRTRPCSSEASIGPSLRRP